MPRVQLIALQTWTNSPWLGSNPEAAPPPGNVLGWLRYTLLVHSFTFSAPGGSITSFLTLMSFQSGVRSPLCPGATVVFVTWGKLASGFPALTRQEEHLTEKLTRDWHLQLCFPSASVALDRQPNFVKCASYAESMHIFSSLLALSEGNYTNLCYECT